MSDIDGCEWRVVYATTDMQDSPADVVLPFGSKAAARRCAEGLRRVEADGGQVVSLARPDGSRGPVSDVRVERRVIGEWEIAQ